MKYLIPERAPYKTYGAFFSEANENNSNFKDYFIIETDKVRDFLNDKVGETETKVLIVDEGHSLFKSLFHKNIEPETKSILVIVFHDPDQETDGEKGMEKGDDDYTLDSQFRCNCEDGYLGFIDSILNNDKTYPLTARDLDFDVRLVKDDSLVKLAKDDKIVIVAGPKYKDMKALTVRGKTTEIKRVNKKDIKESGFLIKENRFKDGINLYGSYMDIMGLETEKIVVIIGDDETNDLTFKDGKLTGRSSVKNMYRIMLTRGMHSCYIFCENIELE